MKALFIVVIALMATAVLFWALLLFMGWLASFVGEGTYTPEAKTQRKSELNDESRKAQANESNNDAHQRTQYEQHNPGT